jgi:hypothetical protein
MQMEVDNMKKILTALTAIGVLAGVALAEDVTSVNIVGYKKHTLESGKNYLVSSQFNSIDGTPITPHTLIGDQLPYGSKLHHWNAKLQPSPNYESSERVLITSPFPPFAVVEDGWNGSVVLDGTKGFWLQVPGPTGTIYEVAFLGEVPQDDSVTNIVAEGNTMLAYPYTADIAFSNTTLYANSNYGDKMHFWDDATQAYISYQKVLITSPFPPFGVIEDGWNNSGEDLVIPQGSAMWYQSASSNDQEFAEIRPYLND